MSSNVLAAAAFFVLPLLSATALAAQPAEPGLWKVYDSLKAHKWVDLTHSYNEQIPHWKGFEPAERKTLYTIDKDGFEVSLYTHVGQWGTHIDPPAHFHKGLRALDQIGVKEQLLPLVVLDIHRQVEKTRTTPSPWRT